MCNECRSNPCLSRCPNYIAPPTRHYCSICGDGIYDGDKYITNDNGEFSHWYCIDGSDHLLEWLGYELKIMEND